MLTHHGWRTSGQKLGQVAGGVNISATIRATCTKYFWRFLRDIGTFLEYLGGVGTSMVGAPVAKKWAKLRKCMGECAGQYLSFYKGPMYQILFGGC